MPAAARQVVQHASVATWLVARTSYPEVPPRVEYALTAFGRSTALPLLAICQWSVAWQPTLGHLYDARHQLASAGPGREEPPAA